MFDQTVYFTQFILMGKKIKDSDLKNSWTCNWACCFDFHFKSVPYLRTVRPNPTVPAIFRLKMFPRVPFKCMYFGYKNVTFEALWCQKFGEGMIFLWGSIYAVNSYKFIAGTVSFQPFVFDSTVWSNIFNNLKSYNSCENLLKIALFKYGCPYVGLTSVWYLCIIRTHRYKLKCMSIHMDGFPRTDPSTW